MNYLVTHYKNLAEQLQARINHIQQCLYEMDTAAGGGIGQFSKDTNSTPTYNTSSSTFVPKTTPAGYGSKPSRLRPGQLNPDPKDGPNGPSVKDYIQSPYDLTRHPVREEFNSDEAFEQALIIYQGQLNRFLRAIDRYNRTRTTTQ